MRPRVGTSMPCSTTYIGSTGSSAPKPSRMMNSATRMGSSGRQRRIQRRTPFIATCPSLARRQVGSWRRSPGQGSRAAAGIAFVTDKVAGRRTTMRPETPTDGAAASGAITECRIGHSSVDLDAAVTRSDGDGPNRGPVGRCAGLTPSVGVWAAIDADVDSTRSGPCRPAPERARAVQTSRARMARPVTQVAGCRRRRARGLSARGGSQALGLVGSQLIARDGRY